jgi:hypothetical protein
MSDTNADRSYVNMYEQLDSRNNHKLSRFLSNTLKLIWQGFSVWNFDISAFTGAGTCRFLTLSLNWWFFVINHILQYALAHWESFDHIWREQEKNCKLTKMISLLYLWQVYDSVSLFRQNRHKMHFAVYAWQQYIHFAFQIWRLHISSRNWLIFK